MQGPYTAQTGFIKGGTHCRQGGGHGHHGSTGLYQQSTGSTTRHQHIQNHQQGPHQQA